MNVNQYVKLHRNDWKQLEEHILLIQRGKHYDTTSLENYYKLYRKATQHLSYCQTYFPNEEVTSYLNGLVSKAHNLLYKDQVSSIQQMKTFFSTTFIRLFIEQWKFVLVATLLFILGGIGSFISIVTDPLHAYTILPSSMADAIDPSSIGQHDGAVDSSLMSAAIMTNNIQVAILAFAGGITLGILTTYVLIYNGIIVGAIAAIYWNAGKTYEFWAYIVPHGMIELTAIFIAGGAGLLMGYKLFVPGDYTRGYQLKVQAKRSVQLLLGTIPLFVIAGIIEGFITPAPISLELKYFVAFITVVGLVIYILVGNALWKTAHYNNPRFNKSI